MIWRRKPKSPRLYDLDQLIDQRIYAPREPFGAQHIICDIDQTYLETAMHTLMQLARIPFENESDKITIPGAAVVLHSARWSWRPVHSQDFPHPKPTQLHFVSASPPQLRRVLERKWILDRLDWTTDTFKNQAYNIKRRRMDMLRQHIAYKSASILKLIARFPDNFELTMIGDSGESDALIYMGIKLLCEGKLDAQGYAAYLNHIGANHELSEQIVQRYVPLAKRAKQCHIFIRSLPKRGLKQLPPITLPIIYFRDYWQAALHMTRFGLIHPLDLDHILMSMLREDNLKPADALVSMKDYFSSRDNISRLPEGWQAHMSEADKLIDQRLQPLTSFKALEKAEADSVSHHVGLDWPTPKSFISNQRPRQTPNPTTEILGAEPDLTSDPAAPTKKQRVDQKPSNNAMSKRQLAKRLELRQHHYQKDLRCMYEQMLAQKTWDSMRSEDILKLAEIWALQQKTRD